MSDAQPPAGWYPDGDHLRYWDGDAWTDHRQPLPVQQPGPVAVPRAVVVTDAHVNGVEVAVAWILAVLTGLYLLPWAIAATRGKSNSGTVGLVNLLLGWTVIGWIGALVMACGAHRMVAVPGGY